MQNKQYIVFTKSYLMRLIVIFILAAIDASAQYTNIFIGNGAPETSIAIDPNNTNRMIAAGNIDNCFHSSDAGNSWIHDNVSSAWGNYGDPNIVVDGLGTFHYFHLVFALDRIVSQRCVTFPSVWSAGAFAGQAPPPKLQDHEWAYADWNTNHLFMTWSQYDAYPQTSVNDSSNILFSASYDHGITWSPALRINKKAGDVNYADVIEPRPFTGPNGEVYVSWCDNNQIYFDISTDSGLTWLTDDIIVAQIPGTAYYNVSGINRIRSTPFISVDKSNGPNHGTIYISWCDQRNGLNNTDVWMVKSTNGGFSWSAAVRVNDDITVSHQFLNAMALDQLTGKIYICFYDRRNFTSDSTDFYLATSADGGNTFINEKVNQYSFVPSSSAFFGDYIGIAAHNDIVRPVWMAFDVFQNAQVYTALIDGSTVGINHPVRETTELAITPSAVISTAEIKFTLARESTIELKLLDEYGRILFVAGKGKYSAGTHHLIFDASSLPAGIYICEMKSSSQSASRKFVVMH
jgi:hypothetical protein